MPVLILMPVSNLEVINAFFSTEFGSHLAELDWFQYQNVKVPVLVIINQAL